MVTFVDYKTIEHNTWLIDIIIFFFLIWLVEVKELLNGLV